MQTPDFSRFTDRCKQVIELAKTEADSFGHRVNTAHILVGLLLEGQGVGGAVLKNLGANVQSFRRALAGWNNQTHGSKDEFTQETLDLFSFAESETERLGDFVVGPEHLLLAIIRQKNSQAHRLLHDVLGFDIEEIQETLSKFLDRDDLDPDKPDEPFVMPDLQPHELVGKVVLYSYSEVGDGEYQCASRILQCVKSPDGVFALRFIDDTACIGLGTKELLLWEQGMDRKTDEPKLATLLSITSVEG